MGFQVVRCRREIPQESGNARWAGLFRFHHDCDFFFGQAVEVIDQPVNLLVGGGDLAFERGFLRRRFGGGQDLTVGLHSGHGFGRDGESIEQYL